MRQLEAGLAARLDTLWRADPWKCADTWAFARVVSPDNGSVEISVDAPCIDPIRITVRHYRCEPPAPVGSVVETTWRALARAIGVEVVADSVVAAVLNCIREGRVIALHAGEENA
jgi:hypothetical protein